MIQWMLRKIVGSKNQRELRRIWPIVKQINEIESKLQGEPEGALQERTSKWKQELAALSPEEQRDYLGKILPEAFAVVKNGARRLCGQALTVCEQPMTWEMVHFDVQLIGGYALHSGRIAEMATGEGKTLVATLPLYLNGLTGRGVHLITVNDYLARRDAEWMGFLLKYLGLTVGCIQNDMRSEERREQYACDVTYGTNSEFGFDYLRDNGMAMSREEQVQRGHYFSIVDEVDSVLIDEARTPLIISGPVMVDSHQYDLFKPLVEQLVKRQTLLMNELAAQAKELGEKARAEADKGDWSEVGTKLYKIKMGMPRHKQLLRMMEEPEYRRAMEKAELLCYADPQKKQLFALKEEIFYHMDEKNHEADLSEMGREFLNPDDPDAFVLPDLGTLFADIDNADAPAEEKMKRKEEVQQKMDFQAQKLHNISQLLRAFTLYERDVHYVVEENKVMIVDEHTGRKMPGRRWSDGLHQAVEAKEGVTIDKETQTLATITIQNYFRLYEKLGGMTGTAETEAAEFHDIYKLDVLIIPTNRPVSREDFNDKIYKTRREKYNAVIQMLKERHAKKQPILVGTASVGASETLSRMMQRERIPHSVLNAKYHRQEAEIVARAGQPGAVTVSTNMAGRGTDIKLGAGVKENGGLLVVGTERHESRRIDRQLRGRCARQGDPGETIFFLSFEDDLMRNFGAAERMTRLMERMGLKDGEELEHPWLNRSIEGAQKRVEQRNYTYRKRTLEFDDVMNKQRMVIYDFRNEVLTTDNPQALIMETIDEAIPERIKGYVEVEEGEPDIESLLGWVNMTFPVLITREQLPEDIKNTAAIAECIAGKVKATYKMKAQAEAGEGLKEQERYILLSAIDRLWQEHLYGMDALRDGIQLRSFAQKDPLIEYKVEAYEMFSQLMNNIRGEILHNLFRVTTNLRQYEMLLQQLMGGGSAAPRAPEPTQPRLTVQGGDTFTVGSGAMPVAPRREAPGPQAPSDDDADARPRLRMPTIEKAQPPKAGRNDPCPCGSGKKFKVCCGRLG
ncbi:MAG: preprotein translocase subunit SecA [Verrucomicrobiales bacterium]|nr:preprotein translocase subunit SecA [Verrucomicrobiales bacterium]